jgi:hypothetical protein
LIRIITHARLLYPGGHFFVLAPKIQKKCFLPSRTAEHPMLWESFFYTRTGELWFSLQPGAWRCLFNWGCYENGPLRAGIKDFNFIALFCTCSLPVRSMGVKFSVLRKFRVQFPEAL